jgi:hypothetical protein
MRPSRLVPIALLAATAACNLDAPQQYLVPDVRIIAIRDWVEGAPDRADADLEELLHLEALVANPLGRDPSTVTVDWYGCAPFTGTLPLPPCLDGARLAQPETFASAPGVVPLATGTLASGTPGADVDLRAASPSPLRALVAPALDLVYAAVVADPSLRCQAYVELPIVAIAHASDVTEVAVKRVRISPTSLLSINPSTAGIYVLNDNPAILDVVSEPTSTDPCAGGAPLADPLPAGTFTVCAAPTATAAQTFNQCDADGNLTGIDEELEWQWYVSAGELGGTSFSGDATGDNVDLTPPGGAFTLWVIVRDGRGGSSWERFDL